MSGGAWLMMVSTWSVILWFAGRYFWMVATLPPRDGPPPDAPVSPPSPAAEP